MLVRRDECERVKGFGARVLTLDQVYGVKDPSIECWGTEEEDGGDPPRLWAPNGNYPGTAFTRSIGDNGQLPSCCTHELHAMCSLLLTSSLSQHQVLKDHYKKQSKYHSLSQ